MDTAQRNQITEQEARCATDNINENESRDTADEEESRDIMESDESCDVIVSYQNNGRRRSSMLRQLMRTDPSIRAEIAELKEEHLSSLVAIENMYGKELTQLNERRRAELTQLKAAHAVQQAIMQAKMQHAQSLIRRLSLGQATIPEAEEYRHLSLEQATIPEAEEYRKTGLLVSTDQTTDQFKGDLPRE